MRAVALMLLSVLAGCSAPPAKPDGDKALRVVSLNPCSDAILAEVAPEKLVAVSHYSHDPSATSMPVETARRWPATGGTVEEIIAARADIVVVSSFLSPATRNALDRLGIPVVTLAMANTVEDNLAQVRELAGAVGEPLAGEQLVARIEAALDEAAPVTGSAQPATILWQSGGIVPGEGALVVDLMRRMGLRPADAAQRLGQGDRLRLEAVLIDPPDLLLHAGAQGDEQSRTLHHSALSKLPTRRAQFDPQLYFCGGPSLIRAAERLAAMRDGAA